MQTAKLSFGFLFSLRETSSNVTAEQAAARSDITCMMCHGTFNIILSTLNDPLRVLSMTLIMTWNLRDLTPDRRASEYKADLMMIFKKSFMDN